MKLGDKKTRIGIGCGLGFVGFLWLAPWKIIDTGHRGIETRFGKIVEQPLDEGLHFYNSMTSKIREVSVRERKYEEKTTCFTRDTQNVAINFTLVYYPDPKQIHTIYQIYGLDWEDRVVTPTVLGVIKDTIGKIIADDLIAHREQAKDAAKLAITEQLSKKSIIITDLSFTNLDFDDAYEKAVEEKVVAIQHAARAKNKTVEIEENAKQVIIAANSEAESMRIRSQALSQNKSLIEYEAVQKWDGALPQYMLGNSTPFINLGGK